MNAKQRRKFVREKAPVAMALLVAHKLSGKENNRGFAERAVFVLRNPDETAGWKFHYTNETLKAFK